MALQEVQTTRMIPDEPLYHSFKRNAKFIPRHQFETLVKNQDSDRYVKRFNSWHQLVTMLYAQSSGKQSLRNIQRGMEANPARLYHLGLPNIKRSTLADANSRRS